MRYKIIRKSQKLIHTSTEIKNLKVLKVVKVSGSQPLAVGAHQNCKNYNLSVEKLVYMMYLMYNLEVNGKVHRSTLRIQGWIS